MEPYLHEEPFAKINVIPTKAGIRCFLSVLDTGFRGVTFF